MSASVSVPATVTSDESAALVRAKVMSNSDSGAAAVEEKLKQLLPRVKR